MLKQLWEFKQSERKWHFPVLAALSVGIPLLAGYYTGNVPAGKLASIAGLVILYIHSVSIAHTMITLMACSFGIMFSFSIGIIFGFNPFIASFVLGLYSFGVHVALYYLKANRPPGNFFFIMIASVAICMPFDLGAIPEKIGFIGVGTMISCTLGLLYSILTIKKVSIDTATVINVTKNKYVNLVESATFGLFVGISLLVAHLLELENPYWVPTTCAAVMQGRSTSHIWQRSIQRTLGTFLGLGVTWLILLVQPTPLVICISIILLQALIEWLVVRNYAIAVIFITVLTILLAESGNSLHAVPTPLIVARFFDILTGSIIGAIGGWMLYNERLHYTATRQIRKTKVAIARRK